ncbi:MAG: 3-hydroxyisobutyrate dehydrogenase-like beta-hydroxyacid dehydrogenase [Rhodothermales bacterium]|jgi:3-hydroxyisobutyrate dehydrogenase-like beta-hydroxyacid dehydrogenase
MSDVTLIGLGDMGSALAHAFLRAGHKITVWNRTQSKTEPLVAIGAKSATNVSDAVEASPITMICIDNYELTKNLIAENNLGEILANRTLIQLSTGTPKEAAELQSLVTNFNCEYIDGAIMVYPDEVGSEDALFLFAGNEITYQKHQPLLCCLGGDLRYLGSNISSSAALDMALITQEFCSFLGAIHGAKICESQGIHPELLASMFPKDDSARKPIDVISSDAYTDPGATLNVCDAAVQRIQSQARDTGINSEIPDLISSLFKRAIAAGHGEEHIASVIKVMRN